MKVDEIRKVACVGAGTIGSSWAAYFLWKGYPVVVQDISEAILVKSADLVRKNLDAFVKAGLMSDGEAAAALARTTYTTSVAEAVADVQFIQESVLEKYPVKQAVLREIDLAAPAAIFASSTSGLLMTEIQKFSRHPGRCITAHPYNPPHLIPLVELVKGKDTTEETMEVAYQFYERIGKVPVKVLKEVPGHIANRVTMAFWRECTEVVLRGICSVEDMDKAVCYGPGLRYALMGPFMIYHLGGGDGGIKGLIEHVGTTAKVWMEDMAKWTEFPEESKDILQAGVIREMGEKPPQEIAAWRDEKLVELLKLLNRL